MWNFLLIFSLFSSTFCTSTNDTSISGRQNASTTTISDNNLANLTNAHSASPPKSMNSAVKNELLFLSEMPLEQLLKVKKSIEEIQQVGRQMSNHRHSTAEIVTTAGTTLESRIINEASPQKFELGGGVDKLMSSAMPLINVNQQKQPTINRKTGYSEVEGPWNSKPTKIQTFFQISVTALAFLAFAGYLLCMIVQAIKSKGTTLLMTNANMPMTSASNSGGGGSVPLRRRRRPISVGRRRRRNVVLLSSDNRNDTLSTLYEESLTTPPLDVDMYHALINLAEGYVKLNYFE